MLFLESLKSLLLKQRAGLRDRRLKVSGSLKSDLPRDKILLRFEIPCIAQTLKTQNAKRAAQSLLAWRCAVKAAPVAFNQSHHQRVLTARAASSKLYTDTD